MTVHQLFIDCKKAHNLVRWEMLYNMLLGLGAPLRLFSLMKMYLNNNFHIKNGLQLGYAVSPLLFSFTLEYVIKQVQVNQLLVCADRMTTGRYH
jgi:hypothetical protein